MQTAATTKKTLTAASWKRSLRRRLLAWFEAEKRDLPWRRTRDPYAVWVSEIMLQQTQVATVIGYFERFMAAFPNVEALAAAPEEQVFRLWEGLGYYRRARQLHRAAQIVVAEHGGEFPQNISAARALPGIGRYTAGAILSIAYDQPHPILEANTIRLLSRLTGLRDDTSQASSQEKLWMTAESLAGGATPGMMNQALMELGALVCTPRSPKCLVCPLASFCTARRLNLVEKIPRLRSKPKIEAVNEAVVVVERRGRVLLRKIAEGERWAGLWDFVRFPLSAPAKSEREVRAEAHLRTGIEMNELEHLTTLTHGVTRFRITLDCYRAEAIQDAKLSTGAIWRWARLAELDDLPLSTTGRKVAKLIAARREPRGKRSQKPAKAV